MPHKVEYNKALIIWQNKHTLVYRARLNVHSDVDVIERIEEKLAEGETFVGYLRELIRADIDAQMRAAERGGEAE